MLTKSFKVKCVELTNKKRDWLQLRINEYARIYNIVAKLLPSLPDKYLEQKNPSLLYNRWVKKGNKELLKSDILSSTQILNAMSDAVANKKSAISNEEFDTVSVMNPNIIKFSNNEYEIIKTPQNTYGIKLKNTITLPLIIIDNEWSLSLINHLENGIKTKIEHKNHTKELLKSKKENPNKPKEKGIKARLGIITYNLRDNTISIPQEVQSPKIPRKIDINNIDTIIGIDLGKNHMAVMCAIDISRINKDILKNIPKKSIKEIISLKEIPGVKILKFKYLRGYSEKHHIKSTKKNEDKNRKLNKDVGNKRYNIQNTNNHRISYEISKFASQFLNPLVFFENKETLAKLKQQTWSPSATRTMADYKLAIYGIGTRDINPSYTSQICHNCGAIGIRTKGRVMFHCPSCGIGCGSSPQSTVGLYNADGNASINIALRGLYNLTRPKKEEETVGNRDGIVEEPNTQPNESIMKPIPKVMIGTDGIKVRKGEHVLDRNDNVGVSLDVSD